MPTCQLCKRSFKVLKFETEHIGICARCVNTLNDKPEPAKMAQARWAEKLANGKRRQAEQNLSSAEEWKRRKAERTLADLDAAVAADLHDWLTTLLAKPEGTRDFRIMRAHRRRLLRMEGFADYRGDWQDVARRIRKRDDYKCIACSARDTTLDVHHIVYLSHHGTNQQSNLVTLCRECHQAEHQRIFDWPEAQDPEPASPIQPPPGTRRPSMPAPAPAISPTVAAERVGAEALEQRTLATQRAERQADDQDFLVTRIPSVAAPVQPREPSAMVAGWREELSRPPPPPRLPDIHVPHGDAGMQPDAGNARRQHGLPPSGPRPPITWLPSDYWALATLTGAVTIVVAVAAVSLTSPQRGAAPGASPPAALSQELQVKAIMDEALREWPYLNTPDGVEATREMIEARNRLLADGHDPQQALRAAILHVAPKHMPHERKP